MGYVSYVCHAWNEGTQCALLLVSTRDISKLELWKEILLFVPTLSALECCNHTRASLGYRLVSIPALKVANRCFMCPALCACDRRIYNCRAYHFASYIYIYIILHPMLLQAISLHVARCQPALAAEDQGDAFTG
jgi:hypothetical protein